MHTKILIVDDEVDILQILETLLTQKGVHVKRASGGKESLNYRRTLI